MIVRHVYIERRLTPLNLFLRGADDGAGCARCATTATRSSELAAINIFAGDLLFKNFGVTRYGRVVFYDYDEIEYLTDCRFRTIPPPPPGCDEMSSDVWYPVGPHDMFPEEFATFLLTDPEVRRAFLAFHADLLDARMVAGDAGCRTRRRQIEVLSYPESIRFRRKVARPRYSIA